MKVNHSNQQHKDNTYQSENFLLESVIYISNSLSSFEKHDYQTEKVDFSIKDEAFSLSILINKAESILKSDFKISLLLLERHIDCIYFYMNKYKTFLSKNEKNSCFDTFFYNTYSLFLSFLSISSSEKDFLYLPSLSLKLNIIKSFILLLNITGLSLSIKDEALLKEVFKFEYFEYDTSNILSILCEIYIEDKEKTMIYKQIHKESKGFKAMSDLVMGLFNCLLNKSNIIDYKDLIDFGSLFEQFFLSKVVYKEKTSLYFYLVELYYLSSDVKDVDVLSTCLYPSEKDKKKREYFKVSLLGFGLC